MDNISILDKKNCTGCRMCEQICPVNAIEIKENIEGFIEPYIDKNKCTNCGLCGARCPQLNEVKNYSKLKEVKSYAAKNKNEEEQMESSSGGIFSVIANYVLENGGIVYGASFNDELEVEHIGIESKEKLYKLRGSKYVQSDTKNTYKEVKENLEKGKMVLYSGTPCQIAGLNNYLVKKYENLITIDIVCHGVPSKKIYKKYLKWLEKNNKSKIEKYSFRDKQKFPWGGALGATVNFENGKKKYINSSLDPYYKSFLNSVNYREACYNCKYANQNRVGDITLMDYWGVEKIYPEFMDEKGVSAILINTEKGQNILDILKEKMYMLETSVDLIARRNQNLKEPSTRTPIRENAYKDIDKLEFNEYAKNSLQFKKDKIDIIKGIIPKSIKKQIKKIIRS